MNANEAFEIYAEKFYKKYGFLPLGKDDPNRPSVEVVLTHLGSTFCELLEIKEAQNSIDNNRSDEIAFLNNVLSGLDTISGGKEKVSYVKSMARERIAQLRTC